MRHLPLRVCAVTGVLGEPIWAGNSVAALDGARQITLVSGHWVCLTKFLILLVLFISFSTRLDLAWPFSSHLCHPGDGFDARRTLERGCLQHCTTAQNTPYLNDDGELGFGLGWS